MPLMFLSYPTGSFTPDALDRVVEQVTRDGEALEGLPLTEYVLSTTWVYAREYGEMQVYHGGKPGGNKCITIEINVLQGGYHAASKKELIKRVTDTIGKHAKLPEPRRVYVIVREVAEANWGFDGQLISLEALRNRSADEEPL